MLSFVEEGKDWTSLVFLHPDNHLQKVDALSLSKSQVCLHIHDRVRFRLSLVRVGKEGAGPGFLHPNKLASAQD